MSQSVECIQVSAVVKSFGSNRVLDGVNFNVDTGEIVALLGHNGAGKTTLLRMILGLMDCDSGSIKVMGQDPLTVNEDIRKICGVLSEDMGLYESLTVYDNLKFFAEIYGCTKDFYEKRIDELLEMFHIFDKKNEVIKTFSMGMKKKVAIIRTILHNPKIVLFDEPVNYLDPISVEVLHELMQLMKEKYNTTFIITTHNLDEVMRVCDKVVIIKNGVSVVQKSLQVNSCIKTIVELLEYTDKNKIEKILKKFEIHYELVKNELILDISDKSIISKIVKELVNHDILICGVSRENVDLSKLYMEVEEN